VKATTIYTQKNTKPTVIVRWLRVIHQSKGITKTKMIAYQDFKKINLISLGERVVKV